MRKFRRHENPGGWIGRASRRAFTIIELLVVIIILVIVTLIALPSFTAMLYNQEANLAESLIRAGMKTGRDAALRAAGDDDAAIVFFYNSGGRMSMVPCVRVGTLSQTVGGEPVEREVFVPVSDLESVQLPKNWMLRGYAAPGMCNTADGWYESGPGGTRYAINTGNWVFPETDFYNAASATSGRDRQTFMVRFRARTGEIVTSPLRPALVVSPRPTYQDRNSLPAGPCNANRLDISPDLAQSVRCILTSPGFSAAERAELLGDGSSDTVLAAPVTQLALYDETKLAAGLDVELDRTTGTVYRAVGVGGVTSPRFVNGARGEDINNWINGDTNLNGQVESSDGGDAPLAKLFAMNRYTGVPRALEVQP